MIRTLKHKPKVGDIVKFSPNKLDWYENKQHEWHMEVISFGTYSFVGKCVFSNCHPVVGHIYYSENMKNYENVD